MRRLDLLRELQRHSASYQDQRQHRQHGVHFRFVLGDYGFAAYNAAKGAVVNLTRNMALDYSRENIRVNGVPGIDRHPAVLEVTRQRGRDGGV